MWPYWFLFALPAIAAISERTERSVVRAPLASTTTALDARHWTPGWMAATVLVASMVGYRFEVGGDWWNYLDLLDQVTGSSLLEVLTSPEPGYGLVNWLSLQFGWDIVAVNAMGGAIFAAGLAIFCRSLPRPWLGLTVAVPYLVIVVGMGYSRQGIALSFVMLGLLALQRQSVWKFVLWIALGATFHRTAVLLLPIGVFVQSKQRVVQIICVIAASVGAYFLVLADSTETLYTHYVEAEYQSEGALVRLLMNAVPALLLLIGWNRFKTIPAAGLWRAFAVLSVFLLVVLFLSPSSTAVDRLALYMLPLQLVVFSSLPDTFTPRGSTRQQLAAVILVYYGCVLFVWLTFSTHAEYWVPYRFYPLELVA
jgi:hypothetical protein